MTPTHHHPRVRRRASRAALCAAVVSLAAVPGAVAADPVMPLSEVRPGMTGTAFTVVRGTEITTFPVTVLDVMRSGDGPGGALIVIRAEGPLMDETGGIAEGMSGSPVYVTGADGVPRVIGAIAYGQGDERNVIGGITPIEQMLSLTSGTRALARPPSVVRRTVRIAPDAATARALRRRHPGTLVLTPLRRWAAAGLDRRLVRGTERRLGRGVQVQTVGPRTQRPPVTLRPGATMTAQVLAGDIVLGAIGTVTYVDGPTVLGFGHTFLGAGASRLLLGDGWVVSTIAAPIRGESYKLGEPGVLQGMVVGDRVDGLVGRLGPVDAVSVRTVARDLRRGTTADLRVQMAPQPELVPVLMDLLQAEPVLRVRDGVPSGTLTLRVVVRADGFGRPFVYRNVYASAGDVVSLGAGGAGRIATVLSQNSVRSFTPRSVVIEQTLDPRVRAATIRAARVVPARPRPGARARLVLTLQQWRGPARRVTVPFQVPRGPGGRPVTLRVVANEPGSGFDPAPADLTSALGGESVDLSRSRPVDIAGAESRAVPARGRAARVRRILENALDRRHDAVRVLLPGEEADDPRAGRAVPVPGIVITGGRAVVRIPRR
jgi:hypothetical protein